MKNNLIKAAFILIAFLTVITLFNCSMDNEIYTVTYDGNSSTGGTVPVDANEYTSGSVATVLANSGNLEKTGYSFIGWNTAADGSGIFYEPGYTFLIDTSNITLYARWDGASVTYDGNGNTGGSLPAEIMEYTYETVVTVLENTGKLVKTGYTFGGWNTAADGSGTSYSAGSTFRIGTIDITLYAVWTKFTIESIRAALDAEVDDSFGAAVSVSGDYAVIGAPGEDTKASNAGAVYVFKKNGVGGWEQVAVLYADKDGEVGADDYFGYAVGISGDYIVIGAYLDDYQVDNAGAAYVFKNNGSDSWERTGILSSTRGETGNRFGYAVSISGDNIIVGAYCEDVDDDGTEVQESGVAYIFKKNASGEWLQTAALHSPDPGNNDQFGRSVSISGGYAAVGAPEDGAAYVFRNNGDDNWNIVKELPENDNNYGAFGKSICISGNLLIVGDDWHRFNDNDRVGAAFIYRNSGFDNWAEEAVLQASDSESGDRFGYSVGIAGDYAVIGNPYKSPDELPVQSRAPMDAYAGGAYIYKFSGSGVWNEQSVIIASDAEPLDQFGYSVAVSDDYALVGAVGAGTSGSHTGAVYFYE